MPPKKIIKKFDLPKLQKMQEPITVRVEKVKGSQKMPITLPGNNGGSPGTGYSRDDVLNVEQFVQELAGGGFYEGYATDPSGTEIEWTFGWDPRYFPEKSPSGFDAMPPPAPVQAPQSQQSQGPVPHVGFGSNNPNWLQAFVPPQTTPVMPPAATTYPWPAWNGWSNQQQFGGVPTATPRPQSSGERERERDLEQRLRQQEMAAAQAQYQQQIDRIQMAHTTELSKMREELRRTQEKPRGESDEVKELRAQLAQQQQDRRYEEMMRQQQEMMRQMQQQTQAQIDAIVNKLAADNNKGESEQVRLLREEQRRAEERMERMEADRRHREEMAALRSELNKGPDPMIEYMKESTRQAAETQKEIARNQRESSQMMTQMMVNPVQMMEMMQRTSGQTDELTKQIIHNFGGAFETYRAMMESLVQMGAGGQQSPGMAMLQEGMARASEIANQYMAVKRDTAVHEARAKAQVAAAQAKQSAAYQAPPEQRRGYDAEMLGGTPPQPQSQPQPPKPEGAPSSPPTDGEAEVINLQERRGPTEEEMFGHAQVYDSVKHLRAGVESGGLDPAQAIGAILQGISYCQENNVVVPAFMLFVEGRFADFVDVLLPHAPQEFKDDCVQILYHQFSEEMEDIEDDDGGEPAPPPGA